MGLDPHLLFRDIDTGRGLVVAVSGGGDLLALLLLLHDHLSRHDPAARLLAVTVDHGLRPESAAEARQVASLCAAHGIAHETAVWRGTKPRTGLGAAAREARYGLLADAAARFGADIVLAGHTRDDQAETLAMRAARGEGAGLAGMAAATLFDSRIWIVRPLLGLRRQALRGWLAARGVTWIDDPTNEDPAFERARVRRALSEEEVEALAQRAQSEGAARQALAGAAALLVDRFAARPAPGLLRLDHALFEDAVDRKAAHLALRALLASAGGTPHLPDAARVGALHARLAAGERLRATLSRAVVDARREVVYLRREARDLPTVALAGGGLIWDGRHRVAVRAGAEGAEGWTVAPLGHERADEMCPAAAAGVPRSLARAALAAEPALLSDERPATDAEAAAHGISVVPAVAPFARFLPGFDLALAAALGRLLGAPALPAAPWKHHIDAEA